MSARRQTGTGGGEPPAVDYETWWDEMSQHSRHPSVRLRNRLILSSLRRLSFDSLIDAGCGDGHLLGEIHRRHPGASLVGVDVSRAIIARNRQRLPAIRFHAADLAAPGFEVPGRYDVVVSSEVIEHIEDWRAALDRLAGLAGPGGELILTTQSGRRFPSDLAVGHLRHFELAELRREIEKRGFRIVEGYRKGWPVYDLQKWLYGRSKRLGESFQKGRWRLPALKRALLFLLFLGFAATPRSSRRGPQLFVRARRLS